MILAWPPETGDTENIQGFFQEVPGPEGTWSPGRERKLAHKDKPR